MEAQSRPAKILIVDDFEHNREIARLVLERAGYAVIVADNGAQALELVTREVPDCVLLDVKMPGVDGFSVCQAIRGLPQGEGLPIVFLTAMRDVGTFDRAAHVGGDDFLSKPVRPAELRARVETALRLRDLGSERHRLLDEVRRQRDALTRLHIHREQLTSVLVHDLKSAAGAIAEHARTILADIHLSGNSRDAAEHIAIDAGQVTRMILNLLDVYRTEEEALTLERVPTDLAQVLRDVTSTMSTHAQDAGVSVHIDGAAPILDVDPRLVRRALANLLDDAIRDAQVGSEVGARLSASDDEVVVSVAHVGGEPCEAVAARLDGAAASVSGGRGLGLAFCKLAAEAHGGRIWAEDGAPGVVLRMSLPRR